MHVIDQLLTRIAPTVTRPLDPAWLLKRDLALSSAQIDELLKALATTPGRQVPADLQHYLSQPSADMPLGQLAQVTSLAPSTGSMPAGAVGMSRAQQRMAQRAAAEGGGSGGGVGTLVIGLLLLVVGIVITISGTGVIWYGAIIVGALMVIQGLVRLGKG